MMVARIETITTTRRIVKAERDVLKNFKMTSTCALYLWTILLLNHVELLKIVAPSLVELVLLFTHIIPITKSCKAHVLFIVHIMYSKHSAELNENKSFFSLKFHHALRAIFFFFLIPACEFSTATIAITIRTTYTDSYFLHPNETPTLILISHPLITTYRKGNKDGFTVKE